MIKRYSRPGMEQLWSEESKFATWLEVEILTCEAWARKGVIPKRAVSTIRKRANYNIAGFRSLLLRAGTHLPPDGTPSYRAALIAVDPRWGELRYWQVISSQGGLLTPFYVLSALDLAQDHDGAIRRAAPENALYRQLFHRTLWISGSVTLLCLAIGFPLAYVMASASAATSNWLMIVVLVPFWASLLVRTTAWIILLQTQGLVNQALLALGILSAPARLVYNRTGVLIAMTHVLLPFLVLPLYSVMRRIPAEHMRAAASRRQGGRRGGANASGAWDLPPGGEPVMGEARPGLARWRRVPLP